METHRPELHRALVLKQKQLVSQSLLEIPVLLVEQTLQRLIENPSFFEAKLSEVASAGANRFGTTGYDHPTYYVNLFRSINNIQAKGHRSGDVMGVGAVGESLKQAKQKSIIAEPDITYQVRSYGDFSMIPAKHFQATAPQLLTIQLPKKLIPFARWLMGQKNWIVTTLNDCYFAIGKAQAGFLFTLDLRQLAELPVTKIRDKLNLPYNTSTYWRLFQNRSVKIVSSEGNGVFPLSALLPTRDELQKYHWIPKFNSLLEQEFSAKNSFSDDELARQLGIVARRTVAKYRERANIPSHVDRQKAYNEGREQPFSTSTAMTMSVPDFDQKTPDYPHGYGRCQCGCNQVTELRRTGATPEWIWKSYLDGHEPKPAHNAQDCPIENTTNQANVDPLKTLRAEDHAASPLANERISTETNKINPSSKHTREPNFGEKTRRYPYGYGYCQCGCGARTQKQKSGIYPIYVSEYHAKSDKQLLELYTELKHKHDLQALNMQHMRLNIENITKLIEEIWNGSESRKQLILAKLKDLIAADKPH